MSEDVVTQFLRSHQHTWRRISRHTRGEHSPEDVQAEAWLMLTTLRNKGVTLDLQTPDQQSLLISYVYQHLVRNTELNVRNAVRLDHSPNPEGGEAHPLARLLATDTSYDPLIALMNTEEQRQSALEGDLSAHQSLTAAYVHLLRHFNNQMEAVADHLMISLSYCYRRCAHARLLAIHQEALPAAAMTTDTEFVPGAWRHFRLLRPPIQLSFDFDLEVHLFTD